MLFSVKDIQILVQKYESSVFDVTPLIFSPCLDIPEWLRHEIYNELPLHHTEPLHHHDVNPFEVLTSSQLHPHHAEQIHPVANFTVRRCSGTECKLENKLGIVHAKKYLKSKAAQKMARLKKHERFSKNTSAKHTNDRNADKSSGYKQITVIDISKNSGLNSLNKKHQFKNFKNVSLSQMNYLKAKTSLLLNQANRQVKKTQQIAMRAYHNKVKLKDPMLLSRRKTFKRTKCNKRSCKEKVEKKAKPTGVASNANAKIGNILKQFYKKHRSLNIKRRPGRTLFFLFVENVFQASINNYKSEAIFYPSNIKQLF